MSLIVKAPSPEEDSKSESQSDSFVNIQGNPPRKRSKVSRACDACRRKKVKCNADYSQSLQKVTKICDNCSKNQDTCTFSRIPLKRGPSKGYIRDLEERAETKRIVLPPIGNPNVPPTSGTPANATANAAVGPATSTNATSTSATGPNNSNTTTVPFWKVPYEMPSHHPTTDVSRRLSVELVLSTSTAGSLVSGSTNSRSRLPSIHHYDSSIVSDSEDDFYSALSLKNSRRLLLASSPRNSISSMSSLNGRILKVNLNESSPGISPGPQMHIPPISTASANSGSNSSQSAAPSGPNTGANSVGAALPVPPGHLVLPLPGLAQNHVLPPHAPGPQGPGPQGPGPQGPGLQAPGLMYRSQSLLPVPPVQPIPIQPLHSQSNVHELATNLSLYYTKFHPNFPILPFNQSYIGHVVEMYGNDNEHTGQIISLFSQALSQLINYQSLNVSDSINLLHKVLSAYPFDQAGLQVQDNILVLFLSSLVILNYLILLSGSIYSLSLLATVSIFNDYKILENFNDLLLKQSPDIRPPNVNYDNIKLYLPKLYLCVSIIDSFYCLSFGIKSLIPSDNVLPLITNLNYLIPPDFKNVAVFSLQKNIINVIDCRNQVVNKTANQFKLDDFQVNGPVSYHSLFLSLVKSKYEFINFLSEIAMTLSAPTFKGLEEDEQLEILYDNIVKLLRLMRNLSNNIINICDFISKIISKFELIQPIVNITVNQIFKLIKLCKLIIDTLVGIVPLELHHRLSKTNTDLLNCYNSLNVQLNMNLNVLSVRMMNTIRGKISGYAMNFNLPGPGNPRLNSWKYEFFLMVLPFLEKEDIEGWL